jgi:hypothetical protein
LEKYPKKATRWRPTLLPGGFGGGSVETSLRKRAMLLPYSTTTMLIQERVSSPDMLLKLYVTIYLLVFFLAYSLYKELIA